MKTVDIRKASGSLREYARQSREEPIVVTAKGKPVAAVVPLENTDMETLSLSTNPAFLALIERARQRHEKEGGITNAEMRRRLNVPNRKAPPSTASSSRR